MNIRLMMLITAFYSASVVASDTITVNMTNLQSGEPAGTVTITQHAYGTVFTPDLKNLNSGSHGFHVHEIASCGPKKKDGEIVPGGAAGGHYDPANAKRHAEPWSFDGHKGDLPALFVDENGNATQPVLSPRLKLAELRNRALMIHLHGDNYSDDPKPLGGGGPRLACGVIKS